MTNVAIHGQSEIDFTRRRLPMGIHRDLPMNAFIPRINKAPDALICRIKSGRDSVITSVAIHGQSETDFTRRRLPMGIRRDLLMNAFIPRINTASDALIAGSSPVRLVFHNWENNVLTVIVNSSGINSPMIKGTRFN
ncbi:hypothetical protein CDAR_478051 [Caerostris darwini]|uniref:Uncharacterized protein n=1 Tax=Caerostris darwini TaxID=1538125 RepID=A0AAV4Q0I2_9ARAC|nr:hypothetical protein CDAR_478051 [Caerostris darwini]